MRISIFSPSLLPLLPFPEIRPALQRTGRALLCGMALGTVLIGAAALSARSALAQGSDTPRLKTQSPYFYLPGGDSALDALPLKATQVDVRIAGVIADVTVTQTYRNEGQRAIEAKYVFPGSTRAAVHAMSVRLADRLITAQIREKQQARAEFDTAKKEGKTAALLEQQLPNVFQMQVANILPGDEVRVELRYTELLLPHAGNYQFVFPAVVGPRYHSAQPDQALATWVAQPFLRVGQGHPSAFDLKAHIDSPIGMKEVLSPSHAIDAQISGEGGRAAAVALRPGSGAANNRDFILDYRLAGDAIESGLLLLRGEHENFFLAMIEPPKAMPTRAITPREYIFVVDISGSMHGFALDTAKALLRELIGALRPADTFNVLLFSGSNSLLAPQSVPATQANIDNAIATIDGQRGGGSTELMPALRRIYAQPKTVDRSRSIVVVTDGYVTVEREAFALVRQNLGSANLFAFGIGSSVNRHLIEGLARAGMGEPFIITQPAQAAAQAKRFGQMIAAPVLTSVSVRFDGLDVYDVEPPVLPDVLAERPVILFGKWRATPGQTSQGNAAPASGHLQVSGHSASGPYRHMLALASASTTASGALRHLWARQRIATLGDQEALEGGGAQREAITALGLKYHLLSDYTSFIAVDEVVRALAPEDSATVNQPSPLPQGVSELAIGHAVGATVPSTPEPATWGAILVTLSVMAMLARRQRRAHRQRHHFTA